jgi:hypothetical protein
LIQNVAISQEIFIEFGVESYQESNTRFLLINNNWKGLVMDGSEKNIQYIQSDAIYWQHDLTAKAAFVTAENINSLIQSVDIQGNIGILHIDIDGNDYWIWKALQQVTADIVIMEYNSIFGCERAITTPYKPDFVRTEAHYSYLYAGSSLLALCDLAEEKGYYFVGSNSAGNNAFFVKKDKIGILTPLSAKEGYVFSKFRQSRDEKGNLNFPPLDKQIDLIKGLPVFNTRTQKLEKI